MCILMQTLSSSQAGWPIVEIQNRSRTREGCSGSSQSNHDVQEERRTTNDKRQNKLLAGARQVR